MNTLLKDLNVRGKEYNPESPLGEYLRRWAMMRGITQIQMAKDIGYHEKYPIWKTKGVSLHKFLDIVDYLSKNSGLSEEFYLARLKQVIRGKYRWRN